MRVIPVILIVLYSAVGHCNEIEDLGNGNRQSPTDDRLSLQELKWANNFCKDAYLINARINFAIEATQTAAEMMQKSMPSVAEIKIAQDSLSFNMIEIRKSAYSLTPPMTHSAATNKAMNEMVSTLKKWAEHVENETGVTLGDFTNGNAKNGVIEKDREFLKSMPMGVNLDYMLVQGDLYESFDLGIGNNISRRFPSCVPDDKLETLWKNRIYSRLK